MNLKSYTLIIGAILLVFQGCTPELEVTIAPDLAIPHMSVDALYATGDTVVIEITDSFDAPDLAFFEELIPFLLLEKQLSFSQEPFLVICNVARGPKATNILMTGNGLDTKAGLISVTPKYRAFWESGLYNPGFRGSLITLEHFYGKYSDPEPKDGVIYNAPIFQFLFNLSNAHEQQMAQASDLDMVRRLVAEIHQDEGTKAALELFLK